ncbi:Proline dehydrogenase 1 [Phytophthora rubi]|uniref:Proline dehydrogenase n=1 Tax=Phytophthora rubi TaxID=129364 RepID=A0A6A3M5S6_9STRA|nr:Proline dehydrogenase 1 [Phytophthora rubi]KAE9025510.1 Proline dehydrogenase 1 [Phytophthora rubi]
MARAGLPRPVAATAFSSSAAPRPSSAAPTAAVAPVAAHEHSTLDQSKKTSSLATEFQNTERIFATKTTPELVRAFGVYFMSQFRPLVQHSGELLELSYKLPGAKFTDALLRATFFGHFCAGQDVNEIRPVIKKLESAGIGAILDFAAEADVEQPRDLNGVDQNLVSARTYAYDGEAACDANAAISRHAIIDASETASTGEPAFVAIKCTALGKPELLMRMSAIIVQAQLLFHTLDGPNLSRAKSRYLERMIDYPTLSAGLRNAGVDATEEEIQQLFAELDQSSGDGVIDYVDWVSFLDPFDLTMGPLTQFIEEEPLSDNEKTQLRNMIARLESLANDAAERGVKLMVDAEQTYMQPAIDHLTLNLQRKYNRDGADVIYNTFQCYLKMSSDRIDIDLERARREKFRFAAKLVRGAYMVQERKRARDKGYADPIHDTIEDTHANYDSQVTKLLRNNNLASFMVASHNEKSVVSTVQQMQDIGISRATGGVYFGQLLGMCDHVSYTLGADAYKVFKYVPYGPIHEVLPYLIRRAQENSGLMSGAQLEMRMLRTEIKRRMFG